MARRAKHRWRKIAAIAAAIILVALCGLCYSMLRRPDWYRPPVIAEAERQQVRDDLMLAQQQFTEGLRLAGKPFVYNMPQRDVNRWLTMRRGIYPTIDKLRPDELADPFVRFGDDCITVAGQYATPVGGAILSIDVVPTIEDGAIVLRAARARCGSIPLPMWFGDLSREYEREAGEAWDGSPQMSGNLIAGLRIDSTACWWNGKIDYRVLRVWIEPGVLHLEIDSLGPRQIARRNHD